MRKVAPMHTLRYLNGILTVLALLLALNLWTAWTASPAAPDLASTARAQGIPDEGAQRQRIIDQLKLLNQKTEGILALLGSGKVRVQVVMPPEQNERP